MRYHDAILSTVSLADALAELARHEVTATVRDDKALICKDSGDIIATADEFGDYDGGDIVGFLGY